MTVWYYWCSCPMVTSSRMHGNVLSRNNRVVLKLISTSNNSGNNYISIAVWTACFDLDDRGRIETDHGLAPGCCGWPCHGSWRQIVVNACKNTPVLLLFRPSMIIQHFSHVWKITISIMFPIYQYRMTIMLSINVHSCSKVMGFFFAMSKSGS